VKGCGVAPGHLESRLDVKRLVRGVLLVGSIGLALHLVLPQIPGLERSLRLLAGTSHLLVGAAFLAELVSELCYAELLGRSVGVISAGYSSPRSREPGRWFMLRLTVTGYGAAHVLPGGGAAATAVAYGALRRQGYNSESVGLALAAVSVLVYGALGILFSGSLLYMLLDRDLGPADTAASVFVLALTVSAGLGAYVAYRRPTLAKNVAERGTRFAGRLLRDEELRRRVGAWSAQLVARLVEELRAARRQLARQSVEIPRLAALALGYWAFDALCLILMFNALGVAADPLVLLVAYGVATAFAAVPVTPGGIGIFEVTMLATLALLGVGSEAAIPILGYRLFNFWLPIPLAAIFYPTLRRTGQHRGPGG
jgi:glycosyltransferase 2 family protein